MSIRSCMFGEIKDNDLTPIFSLPAEKWSRACLEPVERPVEGPAEKLILFDKGVQID